MFTKKLGANSDQTENQKKLILMLSFIHLFPEIVVGENREWQFSHGDCTIERNSVFHINELFAFLWF